MNYTGDIVVNLLIPKTRPCRVFKSWMPQANRDRRRVSRPKLRSISPLFVHLSLLHRLVKSCRQSVRMTASGVSKVHVGDRNDRNTRFAMKLDSKFDFREI